MLTAPVSSLLLLLLALVALAGAVVIARGGFIRLAVGALIVALLLSVILSSCAVTLLEASSGFSADAAAVVFLRGALAAMAQPTIAGIVLLAMLVVLAMSTARVCGLVEDIQILLDAHKAVAEVEKPASSQR
ncbi:hypothetical protein TraAM80_04202 [Trypanosoma rangeli]|uniref:Uncharacterized protein n=1 Tax=Trypanosoma rangeli TaxID=5698 RepID=A0A422NKK4_TRYRA|nr:uncharacterized protein TraAM80_04202 [Trypanosoma rangeli]RNF06048.1 hypothetical protein TraAM80_04202 [Trypanosoma rangeli]|eukprot:RNF06048.1 hypothetical protein TraAM80_04202 [Trypanosoma rangeli]